VCNKNLFARSAAAAILLAGGADIAQAAIVLVSLSGPTTEAGGEATLTVVLTTVPSAQVTISVASQDLTEGVVVSTPTLIFTPANSGQAQTVTVKGVDDSVDDGNVFYDITFTPSSTDPDYDGPEDQRVFNVNNQDDDTAGLQAFPANGLTTTEAGASDDFLVVLTSEPLAEVTVNLSVSPATEAQVSPASLTFTDANWSELQTVTIQGLNDSIDENVSAVPYAINLTAGSSDQDYNGKTAQVRATNADDDQAGITVTGTENLMTSESGGTASFTLVLNSQPTAPVTFSPATNDASEGTIPNLVSFTASNWNQPQPVTVVGADDSEADGDVSYSVSLTAESADGNYDLQQTTANVSNIDNDRPGIILQGQDGRLVITTEQGSTSSFTVRLASQPTAAVTLTLAIQDASEGKFDDDSTSLELEFIPANWDEAQTVTVVGQDDDEVDGNITYPITAKAASSDPNYVFMSVTFSIEVIILYEDVGVFF
jgi:hypothetical protein